MVNSEEFSERLKLIFDYYDLSASSFADQIDVGRASISHILSGRNKPSLDFVMKVVSTFKEVELYWLLNGKGSFPASTSTKIPGESIPGDKEGQDNSKQKHSEHHYSDDDGALTSQTKQIQKVIIFYTDGSFESYQNNDKA